MIGNQTRMVVDSSAMGFRFLLMGSILGSVDLVYGEVWTRRTVCTSTSCVGSDIILQGR
ncbi:hypothetical protein BDV36DRAFT_277438 [Aspergillus pseudocaelatus]|uniref:Uncharacterized protein n=1 Tax=Aspergillus pseudocaelatus TaxID=1825620 RepID=A0ABQ6W0A2_9EURO|nr:hypothetical protein BDV36DRAFT_277438 [Aspergillus pseudocaelatus]